jgi:hypothetical protein
MFASFAVPRIAAVLESRHGADVDRHHRLAQVAVIVELCRHAGKTMASALPGSCE